MRAITASLVMMTLAGCASAPQAPIKPVASVDLPRYMGKWYVIATIPTFIEKNSSNAVESYELRPDGRIQTTYTQRKGGFDGTLKTMHPVGTVQPGTHNAVWGMQFIWPIKAEYIIAYLDEGATETIVARNKRDYVWIMARSPEMPQARYDELVGKVAAMGYDTSKLRRVPQKW